MGWLYVAAKEDYIARRGNQYNDDTTVDDVLTASDLETDNTRF